MKKLKTIMPVLCSTVAIGVISPLASCNHNANEDTPINPKIGEFTKLDADFIPKNQYEITADEAKWGIDSPVIVTKYFEKIKETNGQVFVDDTVWRTSHSNLCGSDEYVWHLFVNLLPDFQVRVNKIEVEPSTRIIKNLSYTWKNTGRCHFSKIDIGGDFEITMECSNILMKTSDSGNSVILNLLNDDNSQEPDDIKIKLNASGELVNSQGSVDFGEKTTFGEDGNKTLVDFLGFLNSKDESWLGLFIGILACEFGIEPSSNGGFKLGLPIYYLKNCYQPIGWVAKNKEVQLDAKFSQYNTNYFKIDTLSFPLELNPLFSEMEVTTDLSIGNATFYLKDGSARSFMTMVDELGSSNFEIIKDGNNYTAKIEIVSGYEDDPTESEWNNVEKLIINQIDDDDTREYTYTDQSRGTYYFLTSNSVNWVINLTKE